MVKSDLETKSRAVCIVKNDEVIDDYCFVRK